MAYDVTQTHLLSFAMTLKGLRAEMFLVEQTLYYHFTKNMSRKT